MGTTNGRKTAEAPPEVPVEPQPEDGRSIDIRELLQTIGEYEITKRMMAQDIATLQAENASLREQLEGEKG